MFRDWFRPPRQLVLVFLVVALVSTGALAWLTWSLVVEDRATEAQRRQDSLDQAVDAAAAAIERQLIQFERVLESPNVTPDSPGSGIVFVSARQTNFVPRSSRGLLFRPVELSQPPLDSAPLAAAERLEARGDVEGAFPVYSTLATTDNRAVRAAALTRLAGVQRKRRSFAAALEAYEKLDALTDTSVDGLPASLVARLGRASLFEETRDTASLRRAAKALGADLEQGRWPLSRSQYFSYFTELGRWLGAPPPQNRDALTTADSVGWLWKQRNNLPVSGRRLVTFDTGSALVSWRAIGSAGDFSAIIVGPTALATLVSSAVRPEMSWAVADLEGRVIAGNTPPARQVATRSSVATNLPWTLHVFSGGSAAAVSPRQPLLLSVLGGVIALLIAGWYFIWRGISREVRVSRLQSDFVASVSHEFRSPLTSMHHIAELLAHDRIPSEDRKRRSYALLLNETDRLGRLVENLLDFGRLQAGAAPLRLEPVPLPELVLHVVGQFRDRHEPGDRRFELLNAPSGLVVMADREALDRALWNLLDNAVKYSPHGRSVWVEVSEDRDAGRASIAVRDDGVGIPADEIQSVFERFVRGADAKSNRISGTGIGLAMVREIARAHHGTVGVSSEPGCGSTFTLSLPLATEV